MLDYINYYDDVCYLEAYVNSHYPRSIYENDSQKHDVNEFRKADSKRWASRYVLYKCSQNFMNDPLDILESMENDFQINSIFSKQKIIKEHYNNAVEAVVEIKNYLLKRRS